MKIRKNYRVKVTRVIDVYGKQGTTNIAWAKGRSGVYKIFRNKKLVYIGHSTYDLYKTVTRHFQKWDKKQYRVTYYKEKYSQKFQVQFGLCDAKWAVRLERALIKKNKPKDNEDMMQEQKIDKWDQMIYDEWTTVPAMTKAEYDALPPAPF